jgi:GNAT superfamily N-acetyltransferase
METASTYDRMKLTADLIGGSSSLIVRPVREEDLSSWEPLWSGYNAFYGRSGTGALASEITAATWKRFHDPAEPVYALVAETGARLVGLAHYLFHRSTTRIELTCYLQDLFTLESARGQGIGMALILAVYDRARAAGVQRVYWQTHETNAAGRRLYDKVARHAGFIVYRHEL